MPDTELGSVDTKIFAPWSFGGGIGLKKIKKKREPTKQKKKSSDSHCGLCNGGDPSGAAMGELDGQRSSLKGQDT